MKIAILYEVLGRSRGGIEAWIYHASEELSRQGHDITVINAQAPTPSDAVPDSVRLETLRAPERFPLIIHWIRAMYFKKQLEQRLKDYDAVWTRSFLFAWAASRILGSGKAVYVNAAPYPSYGKIPFCRRLQAARGIADLRRAVSAEIAYLCAGILEKHAIKSCINVFLSAVRKNETLTFYKLQSNPPKCHVIPAGVNLERFHPSSEEWNGNGTMQLISVCRLAKDKNIQCVIKAVAELTRTGVPVRLTVVGEGHYENELKHLVDELDMNGKICFEGRQESVEDWYRKSHVFVLPSLYEGFGSVYVEAMGCGLPCIAVSSKSGKYSVGADEIIEHGITGFLMEENSPAELAEYLRRLYTNADEWKLMAAAARTKAEKKFRWEPIVKELLQISSAKTAII